MLLTFGGIKGRTARKTAGVLNLSPQPKNCTQPPNYPTEIFALTDGFTDSNGRPVFCGGDPKEGLVSKCYAYNVNNNTWEMWSSFPEELGSVAAKVGLQGDYWITSGSSSFFHVNGQAGL